MSATLYMNNNGSRWTYREKEPRRFCLRFPNGDEMNRHADYFESLGNFALTCFRYNGKRYSAFAENCEQSKDGLPIILFEKAAICHAKK